MRGAPKLITCKFVVACVVVGCGQLSRPIVADELPIGALGVFTERLAKAPRWVQATLDREAQSDFDKATLREIVAALREKELYEIPVSIVESSLASNDFDFKKRFSIQFKHTSLRHGLQRLLQSCGLVADYRFEQFVITTTEDARNWTDQSGVMELKPPPGSRWATILDDETGVEFHDVATLAEQWTIHYGVEIKLEVSTQGRSAVTIHSIRRPNRERLRILSGRQEFACRFDGDILVIARQVIQTTARTTARERTSP